MNKPVTVDELRADLGEMVRKLGSNIELTLPWPPSVNRYWRTFQGRMIISKEGRLYRDEVIRQVQSQTTNVCFKGRVRVEIEAWRPDNRKRDLDNLLKATLDGLTHAGLWADDGLVVDLRIYWAPDIAGMLKVRVKDVE